MQEMLIKSSEQKENARYYRQGIDDTIDYLFDPSKKPLSVQLELARDIARSVETLVDLEYPAKGVMALIHRFSLRLCTRKKLQSPDPHVPIDEWSLVFGQLDNALLSAAIRSWVESGKSLLFSTSLAIQTAGRSPGIFQESEDYHVRMFKTCPIFSRSLCFMSDATALGLIQYAPSFLRGRLPNEVIELVQDNLAPSHYTAKEFFRKFGDLEEIYKPWPDTISRPHSMCYDYNGMYVDLDAQMAHGVHRTCPCWSVILWSNEQRRFIMTHDRKVCKLDKCGSYNHSKHDWQGGTLAPVRFDNKQLHVHSQVMGSELLLSDRSTYYMGGNEVGYVRVED